MLSFPTRCSARSIRFPAYSTGDSSPVSLPTLSAAIRDFSFVSSMAERTSLWEAGRQDCGSRVLIPYLLFDVFQTHTSLYRITVPYSVSFVSSAVLPAFPVPLPLPAPADDWHNREHRTAIPFPSHPLLMDTPLRYKEDRLHGAGKTPKTDPSEGNACKISSNAKTLLLKDVHSMHSPIPWNSPHSEARKVMVVSSFMALTCLPSNLFLIFCEKKTGTYTMSVSVGSTILVPDIVVL